MPSLRARYVVPAAGRVLEDAVVAWKGDEIAYVGPATGKTTYAAPHGVVIPGLVNAHAHLELSALRGVAPAGTSFADWIIAFNRASKDWPRSKWRTAITEGARRATKTGTTAIGDVVNRHWLLGMIHSQRRRIRAYLELLEPREGRDRGLWETVRNLAEYYRWVGLSPHAPWSTTAWLIGKVCAWARKAGRPVAIHASETKEENRLLLEGGGDLVRLFHEFHAPLPFVWPPGERAIPYLDRLGALGPTTNLIHANYLDDGDIRLIRKSRATVTFCPGSHEFFRHEPHPLPRLLRAGVPVALGTDSWASNTDLDMRLEMKRVAEEYGLPPWKVLTMATLNGARALFPGEKIGRLEKGWQADFTVLDARPATRAGLADWITRFRPPVHAVAVAGRLVHRSPSHLR